MSRLNQQPENTLITLIGEIDDAVRELKTGIQYVEAKLYEQSTANSYDIAGSLAASSGSNVVIARLIITMTSVDAVSFISTMIPALWIPNMSTEYRDTLVSNYQILYNQIITDDPTVTQYWFQIAARNAVSASTFYFKARIYTTVPVSVAFARLL